MCLKDLLGKEVNVFLKDQIKALRIGGVLETIDYLNGKVERITLYTIHKEFYIIPYENIALLSGALEEDEYANFFKNDEDLREEKEFTTESV